MKLKNLPNSVLTVLVARSLLGLRWECSFDGSTKKFLNTSFVYKQLSRSKAVKAYDLR